MNDARAHLWRQAAALSAAAGPGLSVRARRLRVLGDPPLDFEDVRDAPDWLEAQESDRAALARLAGAVLVSRAWSRTAAGAVLGRAAEAVGEDALDALLELPTVAAPVVHDAAAELGGAEALDALGAAALVASAAAGPALRARLAHLFPPGLGAQVESPGGAVAVRSAQGIRRGLAGAAEARA